MRWFVVFFVLGLSACHSGAIKPVAPAAEENAHSADLEPVASAGSENVCRSVIEAPGDVASVIEPVEDLEAIHAALARATGKRVLLVLDIDDTLLTSATEFGSDSWYDWQFNLPKDSPDRVPCLFDVMGFNFEVGTQRVTQCDATDVVNGLEVDRIMLTSRGANYRAGTIRQLLEAEYVLLPPIGKPEFGEMWRWTDEQDPKKRTYSLSYDQGVFMTTGANKGRVLLHLLKRRGLSYDYVILVDDGCKNIQNMQKALADEQIAYHGLWYTNIVKGVDQGKAKQGWSDWLKLIESVYPKRAKLLRQNKCFN
ncbi:hypothetical protein C7S18_04535 [Ahniella affigens]|uniref:Acid phosphatase n=2 Tax=Ahniella affigens TaxID=2021234 RepID=A0A2P1PNU3_9GAMM|nr:hypothetical protein C7S18_04535 [Ahniella affigens]